MFPETKKYYCTVLCVLLDSIEVLLKGKKSKVQMKLEQIQDF